MSCLQVKNHSAATFVTGRSLRKKFYCVIWWRTPVKSHSSVRIARKASPSVKLWEFTWDVIRNWIQMRSSCITVNSVRRLFVTLPVSADISWPIQEERTNASSAKSPLPTKVHCSGTVAYTHRKRCKKLLAKRWLRLKSFFFLSWEMIVRMFTQMERK